MESMGVTSGCGCKEVYSSYYLSLLLLYISALFLQQHPYFLFIFKMFFYIY